jgi:hypothetical protein
MNSQEQVIELLIQNGWQCNGNTYAESYKIITAKSYPLAGVIITTGGKPKFDKNGWTACVGKRTTTFYKKPNNPERYAPVKTNLKGYYTFQDWNTESIPTKDINRIQINLCEVSK